MIWPFLLYTRKGHRALQLTVQEHHVMCSRSDVACAIALLKGNWESEQMEMEDKKERLLVFVCKIEFIFSPYGFRALNRKWCRGTQNR